jgi:hypothetical protein
MTERPGLTDYEEVGLIALFIADGRWADLGLTEERAKIFLQQFFRSLKGDLHHAIKACFLGLQNALMALRKDTFEAIQQEPPFSSFGRKTMRRLLDAWTEEGDRGFMDCWMTTFSPGWQSKREPQQPIGVEVDTGSSAERAIRIVTADKQLKVHAEYWYLHYLYGREWSCETQTLTKPDSEGRQYDVLDIKLSDNWRQRVYFRL